MSDQLDFVLRTLALVLSIGLRALSLTADASYAYLRPLTTDQRPQTTDQSYSSLSFVQQTHGIDRQTKVDHTAATCRAGRRRARKRHATARRHPGARPRRLPGRRSIRRATISRRRSSILTILSLLAGGLLFRC